MRTARTTGWFYLAFFIVGILGPVAVRGQLFVADDAQATLSNLLGYEAPARAGIALNCASCWPRPSRPSGSTASAAASTH